MSFLPTEKVNVFVRLAIQDEILALNSSSINKPVKVSFVGYQCQGK